MNPLHNDYWNLKPTNRYKSGRIETHYHQKELSKKYLASVEVIDDSIVADPKRYPSVWRTFFSRYKTINLGIAGDRDENVSWSVNSLNYAALLKKSPSPIWKRNHEILWINNRNIARRIIPAIITIIIIMLIITIIIVQSLTSISLTQVKYSFSSNTFPIIFTSITVSHSNSLQPEMSKYFA